MVFLIKQNEEVKYIYNGIFNNIPHLFKKLLYANFIQYDFIMFSDRVLIHKREVSTPIPDSRIPVDLCQRSKHVFNFNTDDTALKFNRFQRTK